MCHRGQRRLLLHRTGHRRLCGQLRLAHVWRHGGVRRRRGRRPLPLPQPACPAVGPLGAEAGARRGALLLPQHQRHLVLVMPVFLLLAPLADTPGLLLRLPLAAGGEEVGQGAQTRQGGEAQDADEHAHAKASAGGFLLRSRGRRGRHHGGALSRRIAPGYAVVHGARQHVALEVLVRRQLLNVPRADLQAVLARWRVTASLAARPHQVLLGWGFGVLEPYNVAIRGLDEAIPPVRVLLVGTDLVHVRRRVSGSHCGLRWGDLRLRRWRRCRRRGRGRRQDGLRRRHHRGCLRSCLDSWRCGLHWHRRCRRGRDGRGRCGRRRLHALMVVQRQEHRGGLALGRVRRLAAPATGVALAAPGAVARLLVARLPAVHSLVLQIPHYARVDAGRGGRGRSRGGRDHGGRSLRSRCHRRSRSSGGSASGRQSQDSLGGSRRLHARGRCRLHARGHRLHAQGRRLHAQGRRRLRARARKQLRVRGHQQLRVWGRRLRIRGGELRARSGPLRALAGRGRGCSLQPPQIHKWDWRRASRRQGQQQRAEGAGHCWHLGHSPLPGAI
mmetsp:Transcript_25356/g.69740  ORF Transcript_25356/g.69740 Transcript_25356/m.69740 type:complete len:557 (-) Transcript_25356:34-1704(-)